MSTKTNITIDQGTTFQLSVSLTDSNGYPIITTGYSSRASMQKDYQSVNSIPISTTVSNGQVTMYLTANASANIAAGRYVYDVKLIDTANNVYRVVEGIATVTPQVTL